MKHTIDRRSNRALAVRLSATCAAMRLLIGLSLFGALIEVLQAIPVLQRDSDIWDWVADTAAVTVVLAIVWTLRKAASARGASG